MFSSSVAKRNLRASSVFVVPCHAFGRYLVQPLRLAIAMMFFLSVLVEELASPARPMERTAAMTSPGFRIGKLLPLPAKSAASAPARSSFEINRSPKIMRFSSGVILRAFAAALSFMPVYWSSSSDSVSYTVRGTTFSFWSSLISAERLPLTVPSEYGALNICCPC